MGIKLDQLKSVDNPQAGDVLTVGSDAERMDYNPMSFAAGETVEMLRQFAGGTVDMDSSSFSIVPNTSEQEFTVTADGTYKLDFQAGMLTGVTTPADYKCRFRLVFDEGNFNGFTEQTLGEENNIWNVRCVRVIGGENAVGRSLIPSQVYLRAGTHKVKVEYKKISTDTPRTTEDGPFLLNGTLVVGSGIGGTIIGSGSINATTSSSPSYFTLPIKSLGSTAVVPGMSASFNVAGEEDVEIVVQGNGAKPTNDGTISLDIKLDDDFVGKPSGRSLWADSKAAAQLTSINFSRVVKVSPGNHTVKVYGSADTVDGIIYESSSVYVKQYRGGLFPIKHNDVIQTDKPTALNFSGSGFTIDEESGSVSIALNKAITAPGSAVYGFSQPSSDINVTNTTSDVLLGDLGTKEFVAGGLYSVSMKMHYRNSHSGVNASYRFKVVIDEGGDNEKIIGYTDDWEIRSFSTIQEGMGGFQGTISGIVPGSYTVKIYASQTSATVNNNFFLDAQVSWVNLILAPLQGGGVGGTILYNEPTGSRNIPDDGAWYTVASASVTVTEDDVLSLDFAGNFLKNTTNIQTTLSRRFLVGGEIVFAGAALKPAQPETTIRHNTSVSRTVSISNLGLAAGTYLVEKQFNCKSGDGDVDIGTPSLDVSICRGGLIPVRKDGVEVLSKPAAWNFVGDNVIVQNVGGTANVFFSGAAGTASFGKFLNLTDTPSGYSGSDGYLVKVSGSELVFTSSADLGSTGSSTFKELTDTPSTYSGQATKLVAVNSGETDLEFITSASVGTKEFLGLDDTPSSYAGKAGYIPAVNGAESAIVFASPAATVGEILHISQSITGGSNITIGSTSPTQFLPQDDTLSFVARSAGTYRLDLDFMGVVVGDGGVGTLEFYAVFDEGESYELTGGLNEHWRFRTNNLTDEDNYFMNFHFVDSIYLNSGSHTVKVYGKREDSETTGSILLVRNLDEGSPRAPVLTLQSIAGSGVGGMLHATASITSNLAVTSTTLVDLANLSASFTTFDGEYVTVTFSGQARSDSAANSIMIAGISSSYHGPWPGGSGGEGRACSSENVDEYRNFAIDGIIGPFPQGQHTITARGRKSSGTNNWSFNNATLTVQQHRGGLIPIQETGSTVATTPSAINFSGSGVDVSVDENNVVTVAISSSTSLTTDTITLGWNDSGSAGTTWRYVQDNHGNDLEVPISAKKGEDILCIATGYIQNFAGGSGNWAQYQIVLSSSAGLIGAPQHRFEWSTAESYMPLEHTFVFGDLDEKDYTLKLRYYKSTNHTLVFQACKLQKLQFV